MTSDARSCYRRFVDAQAVFDDLPEHLRAKSGADEVGALVREVRATR